MIVGGLDVGTTGCKIALYNEQAVLLETYYQEYGALRQEGCHEIDFEDVRQGVMSILTRAAKEYHIDALGVTSFGESFAMLDEQDEILAPSMLYTDPRGQEECAALCEQFGRQYLTLRTGAEPNCMYSISKILWLKNHRFQLFEKCKRILLGEDFIVYMLTGVAQIDYSLAARTAAFDIEEKCWIREIFEQNGIDVKMMSTPVSPGTIAGGLRPGVRAQLGIDYDITVVTGCHDQVAGMIGAGVFGADQAMDGTGTVECIPVILEQKPSDLDFYACGYSLVPFLEGRYACYALSFTGGATLKWFRDNFAEGEQALATAQGKNVYAMLDAKVKKGPSGLLVLPHFAGAATPYMDNEAKAAVVGLTLGTDKIDMYKALMEGTCYEMRLNFDTMKAFTGAIREIRATGGGAASDVWLQIKADILNTAITALSCAEVGAAGTAALAGKAVGCFTDIKSAVEQMAPVRQIFTPNTETGEQYAALYRKYTRLYRAVKEL